MHTKVEKEIIPKKKKKSAMFTIVDMPKVLAPIIKIINNIITKLFHILLSETYYSKIRFLLFCIAL